MGSHRKPRVPVIAPMPDADYERYAGQWVAAKSGRALFGSPEPEAVIDWLEKRGIEGATMVRLPGKNDPKTWTYGSAPAVQS